MAVALRRKCKRRNGEPVSKEKGRVSVCSRMAGIIRHILKWRDRKQWTVQKETKESCMDQSLGSSKKRNGIHLVVWVKLQMQTFIWQKHNTKTGNTKVKKPRKIANIQTKCLWSDKDYKGVRCSPGTRSNYGTENSRIKASRCAGRENDNGGHAKPHLTSGRPWLCG